MFGPEHDRPNSMNNRTGLSRAHPFCCAAVGGASHDCLSGHVSDNQRSCERRGFIMKYLTTVAVAAAVLTWSQLAYAQGWQHCATEGGFCRAPGAATRCLAILPQASTRNASCPTKAEPLPKWTSGRRKKMRPARQSRALSDST